VRSEVKEKFCLDNDSDSLDNSLFPWDHYLYFIL